MKPLARATANPQENGIQGDPGIMSTNYVDAGKRWTNRHVTNPAPAHSISDRHGTRKPEPKYCHTLTGGARAGKARWKALTTRLVPYWSWMRRKY
jgi:hypothetical protein